MTKWEYRVEFTNWARALEQMNRAGSEGWELVAVSEEHAGLKLVFKRCVYGNL